MGTKLGDTIRRETKKRKKKHSLYVAVWAAFSLFAFLIVLIVGGTQRVVLERTYQMELLRSVTNKGADAVAVLGKPLPDEFNGNYNAFLRQFSRTNDVIAYVVDGDGKVLAPTEENVADEIETSLGFDQKILLLKQKLTENGKTYAVFVDGSGDYVYGAKLENVLGQNSYLYLAKSPQLMQSIARTMTSRTVFSALFIFILAFSVSSVVSGYLIRPLTEMRDKAQRFAKGDFDVDFSVSSYSTEVDELAQMLNHARDEMFKADRMQQELIANVSHDFKTPLTMIKAYASMIQEISGDVPEKRNKHAQVIIDETDRLHSLVEDVLELSKLRAEIGALQTEEVNVSVAVAEILERFAYLSETQGYRFVTDVEEGLTAQADEGKIAQVLYNLIGNAVNYTGEDKTVYIALKDKGGDTFRFSVTDTGSGIPKEEIPFIWERYYRASEMHKRPVKGTGLGLSIVRTVLERHGFYFGVESEVGKGSTFFVDFKKAF